MIAGPPEQVDAVIAVVDAQGRLARRVEVDVASHHPHRLIRSCPNCVLRWLIWRR